MAIHYVAGGRVYISCMRYSATHALSDRTFAATGLRLWNSLPVQLRNPDIYGLFRRQLKGYLFRQHEHDAVRLLICSALENIYLLTYLLTYSLTYLLTRDFGLLFICGMYLNNFVGDSDSQ